MKTKGGARKRATAKGKSSVVDRAIKERRALTADEKKGLSKAELERYRKQHPGVAAQPTPARVEQEIVPLHPGDEIVRPIPSIGRIVLYSGPSGGVAPAMVTRGSPDWRGAIALVVIGEFDTTRASDVPFNETGAPGTWSWPPQVEPTREQVPLSLAGKRAATKIKSLAAKIEKLAAPKSVLTPHGQFEVELYAQEIQALAEKMDARTGKPDPSRRKKKA